MFSRNSSCAAERGACQSIRDYLLFTSKRLSRSTFRVTGKKQDFTSLPYSKIQRFSVETAGVLDLDAELQLWFSGLGKVHLAFSRGIDIGAICKMISLQML